MSSSSNNSASSSSHYYAVVQKTGPLEIPAAAAQSSDVRSDLTAVYESYAKLYPNPALQQEAVERDRLVHALSAASDAVELNPSRPSKKGSFFSWMFGSNNDTQSATPTRPLVDDDDDNRLVYTELNDEHEIDSLFSTHSLDPNCIPEEAHAVARWHLLQSFPSDSPYRPARFAWDKAGSVVLTVVGLGQVVDFSRDGGSSSLPPLQETSDRHALLAFAASQTEVWKVTAARAVAIGPNLLAVSWGFVDGATVFYRRVKQPGVPWEAVAVSTPLESTVEALADVLALEEEDEGSALMRVTDMVPLVVETGGTPAATLALSRLGGFVELVPLPPQMWYGPEMAAPPKKKTRKNNKSSHHHYAIGVVPNVASASPVIALPTTQYHKDVTCLAAFSTTVTADTEWNPQRYPQGPPAEHVLAAVGGGSGGQECVTFWSVSTVFGEASSSSSSHADSLGFSLHATLAEAIPIDSVGQDMSIFATKSILKNWRRPRDVQIRPDLNANVATEGGDSDDAIPEQPAERITTISVPVPMISMDFIASGQSARAVLLDANGGVTVLHCDLLARAAAQTLDPNEYDTLHQNDDPASIVPLVRPLFDRSYMARQLLTHRPRVLSSNKSTFLPPFVVQARWCREVPPGVRTNAPPLALVIPGQGLSIVSSSQTDGGKLLAQVPVPTAAGSSLSLCFRGSRTPLCFVACESWSESTRDALSFGAIHRVDPRHMMESLVREKQYQAACDVYASLTKTEQASLVDVVDACRKSLWVESRDVEMLVDIRDVAYIVDQALALEGKSIAANRELVKLALERLSTATLGTSLAIAGLEGKEAVLSRLQSRLVKLGTYELLCRRLGVQADMETFLEEVLPLPILDLAVGFARAADMACLSIICFRHRSDTMKSFQVVQEIPLTVDPEEYQHLIPVDQRRDMESEAAQFIANTGTTLCDWSDMPEYLQKVFQCEAVLDPDDEQVVLRQLSDGEGVEASFDSLETAFIHRALDLQDHAMDLQQVGAFARIALCALHVDISSSSLPDTSSEGQRRLYQTFRQAELLWKLLLDQTSFDLSLPNSATVLPADLETMSLVDLLKLVHAGVSDPAQIAARHRSYFVPLVDLASSSSNSASLVAEAICAYCVGSLVDCDNHDDAAEKANNVRRSVGRAAAFASLSSVALPRTSRLLGDRQSLLQFVLGVVDAALSVCSGGWLDESDCRAILDSLWVLYESLPKRAPPNSSMRADFASDDSLVDALFKDLVLLDIAYRWPKVDAFETVLERRVRDAQTPSQAWIVDACESTVVDLCRSFCEQVGDRKVNPGPELSKLLSALLVDIAELDGVCLRDTPMIRRLLSTELVKPLLVQGQIPLLADFFATAYPEWIDKDYASQQVSGYVSDAVFVRSDKGNETMTLQAAIECQDLLGNWISDINGELQGVRRHLNAAHFINSVILRDSQAKVHPERVRGDRAFDVIVDVLEKNPRAVVIDAEDWSDAAWARSSNKAFRVHFDMNSRPGTISDEQGALPPPPGQAVLHLASLLGLNQPHEVASVNCLITGHCVKQRLFGAAAAVCRTLLRAQPDNVPEELVSAVLGAVSTTVSQKDYDDYITRRELCTRVLEWVPGNIRFDDVGKLDMIMKANRDVEFAVHREAPRPRGPLRAVNRLFHETTLEYSVNLTELFGTLQQHASDCVKDDSLLNALTRYGAFWCIGESTRLRPALPAIFDTCNVVPVLFATVTLALHIEDPDVAYPTLEELQKILRDQSSAAVQKGSELPAQGWVKPDASIVKRLVGRGYSELGARRAAAMSGNVSFNAAVQWAVQHSLDDGFDSPMVILKQKDSLYSDRESTEVMQATLDFADGVTAGKIPIAKLISPLPTDDPTSCGGRTTTPSATKVTSPTRAAQVPQQSAGGKEVSTHNGTRSSWSTSATANRELESVDDTSPSAGGHAPVPRLGASGPSENGKSTLVSEVAGGDGVEMPGSETKRGVLATSSLEAMAKGQPRSLRKGPVPPPPTTPPPISKGVVIAKTRPPPPPPRPSAKSPPPPPPPVAPPPAAKASSIQQVAAPPPPPPPLKSSVNRPGPPAPIASAPSTSSSSPPPPQRALTVQSMPLSTPGQSSASPPLSGGLASSPERLRLAQRGQEIFRMARNKGSPKSDERRRLIEQGRTLLAKARAATSGILPKAPVSSPAVLSELGAHLKQATTSDDDRPEKLPTSPVKKLEEKDGGGEWDFDDDF